MAWLRYAALIRDLELRSEARKAEAKQLADLAKTDQEQAAFLKERLKQHFITHGFKTVETPRFRITHTNNGGLLPVLLGVEPEAYRVQELRYRANMEAVRAALDAGEQLEFACYGERGSSMRII